MSSGCPSCLPPTDCPSCCFAFWVLPWWHLASHSLDYVSEGTRWISSGAKKNMFRNQLVYWVSFGSSGYNLDCVLFTHRELTVCVMSLAWRGRGLPNGCPRVAGRRRGTWWWPTTLPLGRRVNSWRPWRGRSGSTLTCRNCWWSIPLDAGEAPRRHEETV